MGKKKSPEYFKTGDHVLGVFHEENEVDYALAFLKHGFEKNEAVMLITDKIPKDQLRREISKEWDIDDIDALEANRHIILQTPQELLFPHGKFIQNQKSLIWKDLTNLALENGKAGLRIFIDTSPMFKKNLEQEVFKFETTLDQKFDFPCTIVCAYHNEDMAGLGKEIYKKLKQHHNQVLIGN